MSFVEKKDKVSKNNSDEMTFLEHLEELRWRIIKVGIGVILGAILCWIFIDLLVDGILLRPIRIVNSTNPDGPHITLQNLKPFGQVLLFMEICFIGGIVISLPNLFYQLWKFIAPGLLSHERKYISYIIAFSTLCFLLGIAFAYFILLPTALKFFAGFGSAQIENNIAITEYMSFVISLVLATGIVFELPMVSWYLAKLGILTAAFMRKFRRHAIVVILILAAILTPGTDPVSQIFLAIPLMLLYEISIWIAKISNKTVLAG